MERFFAAFIAGRMRGPAVDSVFWIHAKCGIKSLSAECGEQEGGSSYCGNRSGKE